MIRSTHNGELPAAYRRRRREWNGLWIADHILGDLGPNRALDGRRQRLIAEMTQILVDDGPGEVREVDRRQNLDAQDFVDEYLATNTPVVLAGRAKDWPAVRNWTPSLFEDEYGDAPVQLINASRDDVSGGEFSPVGKVTTVGEVVRDIEAGGGDYPRFVPLLHQFPELARAFDRDFLRSLRGPMGVEMMFQFFLGGQATDTALHAAIPNNLFVQVYGRKKWWIYPPKYTPLFRPPMLRATYFMSPVDVTDSADHGFVDHLDGYEVVLEPGDILYNPPFHWHQVLNLTTTIGVGTRWFGVPSILQSSLTKTLLTLLAKNPPIWRARQNRTDFVQNFVESVPDEKRDF